jgi:hypothetical protein
MITLAQAKELKYRDILIDSNGKKWRVNGKVQTWKKNPNRVNVPVKHGLYSYGYITESNLILVSLA